MSQRLFLQSCDQERPDLGVRFRLGQVVVLLVMS
jgi:hypothetical protein